MFDPKKVLSVGGAHMPLMLFIGMPSDNRRTAKAKGRRAERAAARGWSLERIKK